MTDEVSRIRRESLERLATSRAPFAGAEPFPHIVLDDFLDGESAAVLEAAFARASGDWITYHHVNERKRGFNDLGGLDAESRAVIADLQAEPFVHALQALSGIEALVSDPDLDGGGLHETQTGGFLNVHTDFLSHTTRRSWSRQLNLLLFLNRDWRVDYGGALEFWDEQVSTCMRRIEPLFNRCVIFKTSDISFHGVPQAVTCPPDRSRKSLALYYFRDEGRPRPLHPTHYLPRPQDAPGRKLLIHLDRWAVYGYSLLKRYTPLGDKLITKVLRRL